jgi:hypothetical protein
MLTNSSDVISVNAALKTVALDISSEAFLLAHHALPPAAIVAAVFHKLVRLSGQAPLVRNDCAFVALLDDLQRLSATNNSHVTHDMLSCWFVRFFAWSSSDAAGASGVSIYLLPVGAASRTPLGEFR